MRSANATAGTVLPEAPAAFNLTVESEIMEAIRLLREAGLCIIALDRRLREENHLVWTEAAENYRPALQEIVTLRYNLADAVSPIPKLRLDGSMGDRFGEMEQDL